MKYVKKAKQPDRPEYIPTDWITDELAKLRPEAEFNTKGAQGGAYDWDTSILIFVDDIEQMPYHSPYEKFEDCRITVDEWEAKTGKKYEVSG